MTVEEIHELVAPPAASVREVEDWLASFGLVEEGLARSSARDWIKIHVPIGVAEDLLHTVSVFCLNKRKALLTELLVVRNTSFGRTPTDRVSCVPRSIASLRIYTNTLNLSNPRRYFLDPGE